MQKLFRSIILLFISFFFVSTYAQSRKSARDSSVVIIFNEQSTTSAKKRKGSSEMNIVKIAPLGFISGTFPILYERSLNDFLSIQGGVGLTHRNYVRGLITKENGVTYHSYPWTQEPYSDYADPIYEFNTRKPSIGYMATLQPRIYFGSDGLDGSFVGLSFDYYRYQFTTPGATLSQGNIVFTGATKKEYENVKDFMVHFGYQTLYDRVSLEYTTAIGLRNTSGIKYAATTDNTSKLLDGFASYTDNGLNFQIGIKIGYHF